MGSLKYIPANRTITVIKYIVRYMSRFNGQPGGDRYRIDVQSIWIEQNVFVNSEPVST